MAGHGHFDRRDSAAHGAYGRGSLRGRAGLRRDRPARAEASPPHRGADRSRIRHRAGLLRLVGALSGHASLALDVTAHLALPLGTVVLLSFGETLLTMRATMLETMGADHVTAARARGLPVSILRDRHVARVAMLPVLSRLLLSLPFVLVGSLVIERVFFWQAMGQVVFNAIEFQDLPLIVGVLSLVGALVLISHILLDVLYLILDPRLRYG